MKLNSCKLFAQEMELLALMSHLMVFLLPKARVKNSKFPSPTNATGVRAFVNLCGFYRRHILLFSEIAVPMNELLKNVPWNWSKAYEQSFARLKSATTLNFPDPAKPYRLYTDSSGLAIGACLSQLDDDGEERPICFMSRRLQQVELGSPPIVEKEILNVITGFKKFIFWTSLFTLYTDNSPVSLLRIF